MDSQAVGPKAVGQLAMKQGVVGRGMGQGAVGHWNWAVGLTPYSTMQSFAGKVL